ncbi:DUF167 domain-containing protein [Halobacteriovorax sp. HLS]|uniref:DUF167 domain-containing protein n=1 Tax=Halobacteriovorax sp. HLS TaxID=2234000 RepID=UPI000FDA7AB3|nr:DUF167 domain-containing protein [Halobacteriovorax sp. HLS]
MNEFQALLQELGLNYFDLTHNEDGIHFSIEVWAKPGSKLEKVQIGQRGELVSFIKERAVEGAANKGLLKSIAKVFGTNSSNIVLLSGGKSKFKRFSVALTFTDRKRISYYLEKLNGALKK